MKQERKQTERCMNKDWDMIFCQRTFTLKSYLMEIK